jgi:hypothetical protein
MITGLDEVVITRLNFWLVLVECSIVIGIPHIEYWKRSS